MKRFKSLIAVILSVACFFSLFSMSAGAASAGSSDSTTTAAPYSFAFQQSGNYIGDIAIFQAYWPTEANVKWKVSDPSIAKLEIDTKTESEYGYVYGLITFLQAGTFKLKGVDKKTGEIIYKKTITVEPYERDTTKNVYEDFIIDYNNYTIDWPSKQIYAGDYVQFVYHYNPDSRIKWSVSDSSIVELSAIQTDSSDFDDISFGQDIVELVFKKAGTVKIKAVDTTTGKTVVKKKFEVKPVVSKIAFKNGSSYTMSKGDTATLKYTFQNTKGQKVSVSKIPSGLSFSTATSDKNIVKIKSTANGKIKIKAVGSGTAKIKVKANDGSSETATIRIKVK